MYLQTNEPPEGGTPTLQGGEEVSSYGNPWRSLASTLTNGTLATPYWFHWSWLLVPRYLFSLRGLCSPFTRTVSSCFEL